MVMVSIWFHGHQCCYRDTFMRLFNEGLLASGFTSAFAGNIKIVYLMHRRTAFSKTKNEQIVSSLRELEPHLNGLTARPKALQRSSFLRKLSSAVLPCMGKTANYLSMSAKT